MLREKNAPSAMVEILQSLVRVSNAEDETLLQLRLVGVC